MLVDDNRDAAELLGIWLENAGYQVTTAFDPVEARCRARDVHPEIVIVDIGLPVMDRYELAGKLRAQCGDVPLHLIALTGYGQEEERARSQAAGFEAHLVKPVEGDAVVRAVDAVGG
jgi:CheY-like chemotaxis protein